MGLLNELGMWTVQITIFYKKLLYLHKLIHYPDTNIAKQVLQTQIDKPGPTWWKSILEIGEAIGQIIDQEKISNMSKSQWKNEVKKISRTFMLTNSRNGSKTQKNARK